MANTVKRKYPKLAERDITGLIKLLEESSKQFEPGEQYGLPSNTPRVGYFGTMSDKPFPWSERIPRTWGDASDKVKKEKGEEYKIKYVNQYVKDILQSNLNQKQSKGSSSMGNKKGHDAIDNLIVANTLQEIMRNERGEWTDLLYKAQTKGGDDRYIHRGIQGIPAGDRIENQTNLLRMLLENNPAYADTMSLAEGKKRLADYPSIGSRIYQLLFGK